MGYDSYDKIVLVKLDTTVTITFLRIYYKAFDLGPKGRMSTVLGALSYYRVILYGRIYRVVFLATRLPPLPNLQTLCHRALYTVLSMHSRFLRFFDICGYKKCLCILDFISFLKNVYYAHTVVPL